MKKLLILLFICVSMLSMQAQKRYVVAFDCTKSMNHPDGDYTDNGIDDSKLWKPAKDCIRSLWTQASLSDEFFILLFQNNVLEIVKGCKGTELNDWNKIESRMNEAIKKGGNTCILRAWQTAEQYFTENCDFYFITDGVEDHDNNNQINPDEQADIDAVCKKIDDFCNLGINGFYTNLKQSENDNINNQISRKVKQSCFKDLIAGSITPTSLSLNQEDINKGKKTYNLTFNPVDRHKVANVKGLEAKFVDDEENVGIKNADSYFNITISGINNNNIELTIEQLTSVPYDLLDNSNSCRLYLSVSSNDKDVAVFPQLITIDVRYYYEKIAYLPSIDIEGNSKYHPAFFIKPLANLFSTCDFIAEHKPDTIEFDLKQLLNGKPLFNNEALKHNSSYKLRLEPIREKDKEARFILLKNSEICKNNIIDVLSTDNNLKLTVIFEESSEEGNFRFNLTPVEPNHLDKINECANISEASIPISLEFNSNHNPLENLLLWFIGIVLLCCICRIIYIFLSPKMKGQILVQYKDIQGSMPYSIQGCRKFIFYKTEKKQSLIHKLFYGKIGYPKGNKLNPFWESELIIKRNNSKSILIMCNDNYLFNHSNRHTPIICKRGKTTVIITNINNNISVTLNY